MNKNQIVRSFCVYCGDEPDPSGGWLNRPDWICLECIDYYHPFPNYEDLNEAGALAYKDTPQGRSDPDNRFLQHYLNFPIAKILPEWQAYFKKRFWQEHPLIVVACIFGGLFIVYILLPYTAIPAVLYLVALGALRIAIVIFAIKDRDREIFDLNEHLKANRAKLEEVKAAKTRRVVALRQIPDPGWQNSLQSWLTKLDQRNLGRLCAGYCRALGFKVKINYDAELGPNGVGYRGEIKMAYRSECLIKSVQPQDVESFGQLVYDYDEKYFFTTGKFSKPAQDKARQHHINLIDGSDFITKLVGANFGVIKRPNGAVLRVDDEYFDGLINPGK